MHASQEGFKNFIVLSSDTDIVVLALSHWKCLKDVGLRTLLMKVGCGKTTRYLPIHKLFAEYGESYWSLLPAIHHLTGSDYTSKIGTKSSGLNKDLSNYLINFGEAIPSDSFGEIINNAEEYLARHFKVRGKPQKTFDNLRFEAYCFNKAATGLQHINKCHMEDIIEERSIEKICGYALCKKPLNKIITQRYHISTKRNKVYDVSRRKSFCSSFCYSAANYLLEQMLLSPLWLREDEEVREFRLLPDTHGINIPGEEVIVTCKDSIDKDEADTNESEVKIVTNDKENCMENNTKEETQIDEKTQKLLEETESKSVSYTEENILNTENTEGRKLQKKYVTFQLSDDGKKSLASYQDSEGTGRKPLVTNDFLIQDVIQRENSDSSANRVTQTSRKESKFQRERKSSKKSSKVLKSTLETLASSVKRIEQVFKEWITEETLRLLLGEETTKQQVFEDVTKQEKYAAFCHNLNQLQLEDEREERGNVEKTASKPVPHYSFLQEEGNKLQLKVRAFYDGRTVVEIPDESDKNDRLEKDQSLNPGFPLTEMQAPKAIRRKIFLDKINNVLPDLLRALSGNDQVLSTRFAFSRERVTVVKALVTTFALTAENIVFKSVEWIFVGLIIIKMLSAMDPGLKYLLSTTQASLYTSMILMSYQLDSNYLDTFINSVTN